MRHFHRLGLEVEFFIINPEGRIVNAYQVGAPTDGYPLLAEARGRPFDCPYQAVGSVLGEVDRIRALVRVVGYDLLFQDWVKRDAHVRKLHEEILRGPGLSHKRHDWQNLYGRPVSAKNRSHIAAGLHISFTYEDSVRDDDGQVVREVNRNFDYPSVFRSLEKEFGEEIKNSGRGLGFYEVKPDGRVEYRSLPATLIKNPSFASRLAQALR